MLLAVVGRETIDGVNGMALEGQMDGKGDYREIPARGLEPLCPRRRHCSN